MRPPDVVRVAPRPLEPAVRTAEQESCPVCGSVHLLELRCKVVCEGCRTILQSCADL